MAGAQSLHAARFLRLPSDPRAHVRSLETTNRYAEIDLEMKAQALDTCAVSGPDSTPRPSSNWHADSELVSFLTSL